MPNNIKIEFDPALHRYTVNGQVYPHVTGIISETVGHGRNAGGWYLQRGRAIHQCAKLIAEGKQFKNDPRIDGEVAALRRFWKEVKPLCTPDGSELFVASVKYRFAGTLDLWCVIGNKNTIVDYKHCVDKIRTPLQLAAYSIAMEETTGMTANVGYGVQTNANGAYVMTEPIDLKIPKLEFLALRTAYRLKEKCGELSFQKKETGK